MIRMILTATLLLNIGPVHAAETAQAAKDIKSVLMTIYPEGRAFVRENRETTVRKGSNRLLIQDVPRQIEPGSILFQMVPRHPGIRFIEYNFQSDQITRQSLLEGSIGLHVQLLAAQGNKPSQTVRLLAVDQDEVIVETPEGILPVDSKRIAFHRIPYRLTQNPLLTVKLLSDVDQKFDYQVSYVAQGLSWDSSYTIIVKPDASTIDMKSWINVHNASGVMFSKAKLRISEGAREDESVVYSLPLPATLPDMSSKNLAWFTALGVDTTKSFRVFARNNLIENEDGIVMKPHVETWLSVKNTKENGLGQTLPAGMIKVFHRGEDGGLSYVAQNETSATQEGDIFSLRLGRTHDITAEMRQTDYRRLSNQVVESGYTLDLKNHTNKAQVITVVQPFKEDWVILRETHTHHRPSSHEVEWKITVPADDTLTLRYRARMNVTAQEKE